MFLPTKEDNEDTGLQDVKFSKVLAGGIGLGVGVLGGIIGQGGAFLLIPLMLYILRIPTRIALGSSVAIALLSAVAGFLGKWSTDQIPFLIAVALTVGAVLGAQAGGQLSTRARTGTLRVVLAGTALRIGYTLISGMGEKISLPVVAVSILGIVIGLTAFPKKPEECNLPPKGCNARILSEQLRFEQ